MKTLLLDQTAWDLVIDSAGNIAVANEPYQIIQDVCSSIKLFLGELWYDKNSGIPYFEEILGYLPPPSLLIGLIEKQSKTVPGVINARCVINTFENRTVTGQVFIIDKTGIERGISF